SIVSSWLRLTTNGLHSPARRHVMRIRICGVGIAARVAVAVVLLWVWGGVAQGAEKAPKAVAGPAAGSVKKEPRAIIKTKFGEVVKGMGVADKIVSEPRDNRDNPNERIEMQVTIVE